MSRSKESYRHFVVLKSEGDKDLSRRYFERHAEQWIEAYVTRHALGGVKRGSPYRVVALPSACVGSPLRSDPCRTGQDLVAVLEVDDKAAVDRLMAAVVARPEVFAASSPDLALSSADHWCPREGQSTVFSDRAAAERIAGIDYLKSRNGTSKGGRTIDTTGAGVNVVIVDQGLNAAQLGASYRGGWAVGATQAGTAGSPEGSRHRSHGMKIAHTVLEIAPAAGLWDMPLIPWKIAHVPTFLSVAEVALETLLSDIATYRSGGPYAGPWIFVNPWGVFDTTSEYPKGDFTNNPNNIVNRLYADAVRSGIDVVFGAGNCGQFCPDTRCGPSDRGPGHSILGTNSLRDVLTVGAVRADGMWLGYSSQGPGQSNMDTGKPDLCAPSQFRENDDASSVNSGTSTACAMAGGILAALRSTWDQTQLPPAALKAILKANARKPAGFVPGGELERRYGSGIVDLRAAFPKLP